MNIGIIGLGRMGQAIAHRLVHAQYTVWGYDPSEQAQAQAHADGVTIAPDIASLVAAVDVVWLMVAEGAILNTVFETVVELIRPQQIVVDGGNSFYEYSVDRAQQIAARGAFFLDCGTSGGVRGREHGFCLMVGGDADTFAQCAPLFEAVAAPDGYALVGPQGAGHYVKMVHNGIEYGLMQAYAEGFHLMKEGSYSAHLDMAQIAAVWNSSSVIRSFLLELCAEILHEDDTLRDVSGYVAESGMGLWTAQEGKKHAIPLAVLAAALEVRAHSRRADGGSYGTKLLAMMRKKFGGHAIKTIHE